MKRMLVSCLVILVLTIAVAPKTVWAKLDQATKREIDAYLTKKTGQKSSWLPSMKGEYFELHGELELEFVATQYEDNLPPSEHNTTDNKIPHGKLDKVVLMPIGHFNKNNLLKLELEFGQGDVTVPEFYFQSNHLLGEDGPVNLWLRVGRDERFMKPSRITESYPILGTIAWRDDELQVVLGIDTEYVYARGSLGSGMDLGSRAIGEDNSFKVLQDDNNYDAKDQKRELMVGLGFRCGNKDLNYDWLTYYINDRMNNDDETTLGGLDNYDELGRVKPHQERLGSRMTINAYGARLMGEYLYMLDGLLKRNVWYAMLSYNQKLEGFDINGSKWLVGVTPLIRYDNLDVFIGKSETDSRTWDRWGTTVALIIDLVKNVKLKNEYTWNREHTGSKRHVRNDEFLTQLEARF